jgi:hypothetical protein
MKRRRKKERGEKREESEGGEEKNKHKCDNDNKSKSGPKSREIAITVASIGGKAEPPPRGPRKAKLLPIAIQGTFTASGDGNNADDYDVR